MDLSLRARDEKAIHGVASHDLSSEEKIKAIPSASKIMATVFWDCEGVILIDVLPRGQTTNSDVYVKTLRKRFRRVRPHKGVTKVLLVLYEENFSWVRVWT
jgi:hypothetical protein